MSAIIKHVNSTTEILGLIPTTIVSLVLFFAWLAHSMGAPELLGGFAAGLAGLDHPFDRRRAGTEMSDA